MKTIVITSASSGIGLETKLMRSCVTGIPCLMVYTITFVKRRITVNR
jgi:hypothetical protein